MRKILRSLPERFDYKVTAIEKAHDLDKMTANELIVSLETFEMCSRNNRSDKKKTMAFKTSHSNQSEEEFDPEEVAECIVFLSKKFNKKFFKKGNYDGNFRNKKTEGQTSQNKNNGEKQDISDRGTRCHECDGFGYIKSECVNLYKYQKIIKKAFQATHSDADVTDSECDREPNVEHTTHVAITNGECITTNDTTEDPFVLEDVTKKELSEISILEYETSARNAGRLLW